MSLTLGCVRMLTAAPGTGRIAPGTRIDAPAAACLEARRGMGCSGDAPAAPDGSGGGIWPLQAARSWSSGGVRDGRASGPGSWPPAIFHQRLDPASHRRVGGEQVGKAFARVVEAQFHHRRGRARQFAAAFDLAQRRDHGIGVLGQFDRSGVGQQFARSRQRQPHQLRQQPCQRDQRHCDDDDDDRGATRALAVARCPRKTTREDEDDQDEPRPDPQPQP